MIEQPVVTVIGGGLAGVEAAWAAASRGAQVLLHEMRPQQTTSVHRTGELAEIVCSNSLRSARLGSASGLLKEEMRRLGSVLLPAAAACSVPAGEALAVDREAFAAEVTRRIRAHPEITLVRGEVTEIPDARPVVVATGPLTSAPLAADLVRFSGADALAFFDAVAPTVTLESLDMSVIFRASRRGRGPAEHSAPDAEQADYLNCPLTAEQYDALRDALLSAEVAAPHGADAVDAPFFEACMPIEEIARRGPRTMAFGPLKPVGLTDPRTERRPYAVVQLRQENRQGTLWGLVGFQTRLKWSEQRRVFGMIPGLGSAEFVRYGVMHRNTYIKSPAVLHSTCEMRSNPGVFAAGQVTGVEGYMESAAVGILAGLNAARRALGLEPMSPPAETMLGALCRHIAESDPATFSPMNANHGLLPALSERIRDRRARGSAYAERSLANLAQWIAASQG